MNTTSGWHPAVVSLTLEGNTIEDVPRVAVGGLYRWPISLLKA